MGGKLGTALTLPGATGGTLPEQCGVAGTNPDEEEPNPDELPGRSLEPDGLPGDDPPE